MTNLLMRYIERTAVRDTSIRDTVVIWQGSRSKQTTGLQTTIELHTTIVITTMVAMFLHLTNTTQ